MAQRYVATISTASGPTPVAVRDGMVHRIPGARSVRAMLEEGFDAWLDRVDAGAIGEGIPLAEVTLLAPVPDPPNLYMVGANYADHLREMRRLGPQDPVAPTAGGPFFFLKPTTTLIGDGAVVEIGEGVTKLDWEIELAAVIGSRAHRVAASDALEHVAAYTIINDVSARDRFVREGADPHFTFDWLSQKGWATSCPAGPWLLPARDCPSPSNLALKLSVSGETMQDSNTSQMLYSLEEQIAALSALLPLVPGDIVSTGTCAGVGAGRGRFLAPGDVMRAEIEGIGVLTNSVEEA
jgi:2-keto-4-pentenoate hydratase/2-oxohepta-3-ene-1,7-dioic acid hydratase in catechol pathway